MARRAPEGKCNLCAETFGKTGMDRHLAKCRQNHSLKKIAGQGKVHKTSLFHLVVQGTYAPAYWMHLEIPVDATLRDQDQFLRDTWLECCGHLSAFTIGGTQYELDTSGVDAMWPMFFGRSSPPTHKCGEDMMLPVVNSPRVGMCGYTGESYY
jgi:hypothetical protein